MDKSRDTSCARHSRWQPIHQLSPQGSPKTEGSYRECFHWNAEAPSHLALGGSISSALPGENNPNLVLLCSAGA